MKQNKPICMVVQNYFPEDPRVRKYVNSLSKNGYKVDIISIKEPNLKFKEKYQNGTIYRVGIPKKRTTILRYLLEYFIFFASSFLFLNFLFLKKRYSVIHVHNMPDFLVFITLIPKIFGARVILDMHEITPEFFQYKFGSKKKSFVIQVCRFIEYSTLHFADYVVTVTDKIKEIFVNRNNIKNIVVIMNTDYFSPDSGFNISKAEYFEMVYHGILTDLYSLDLPIRAISLVKNKTAMKFRFNIYGDGPTKSCLEKLVKELDLQDTVIFHGKISHEEIIRVLKKMNLGILTFRRNKFIDLSFSNKLSEYVNNCVPVLTTRLPSVLDYFDEDDLLLCDDNIESIREKLLEIINGKIDLKKQVLSAKRKYKDIAWENMEKKYILIVKSLSDIC